MVVALTQKQLCKKDGIEHGWEGEGFTSIPPYYFVLPLELSNHIYLDSIQLVEKWRRRKFTWLIALRGYSEQLLNGTFPDGS